MQLVTIGIGEPKHLKRYLPIYAPHVLGYTTQGEAHRAFGLKRGTISQLFSVSVVSSGIRASRAGLTQSSATGDSQMLSGTFIVDPSGTVRYAYYSKYAGDDPSLDEILQTAKTP